MEEKLVKGFLFSFMLLLIIDFAFYSFRPTQSGIID